LFFLRRLARPSRYGYRAISENWHPETGLAAHTAY